MEANLALEGFKFMALGMGTVFIFLIILIIVMNVMSKIIHTFFPEPQSKASTSVVEPQTDKKKVVAAISAAVMHHRKG